MPDSVFIARDGGFEATELARGPWDPSAQHGGAPAALLMRAFEQTGSPDLAIARVTYELLRPVPLGFLHVQASVARPGRRVQLLEASLLDEGGIEVVRARALKVLPAAAEAGDGAAPPAEPGSGRPNDFDRPGFGTDAMEIRFVRGAFYEMGPATAWFRLRAPLVGGERTSPLQSLAAAGDFGNGISAAVSWEEHVFINPDLTLYVDRPPVGEWICLSSETRIAPGGVGIGESVLYDQHGRVGRATQALLVTRR